MAGIAGSMIILIIVLVTSSVISVPETFSQSRLDGSTNFMFPFILSFVTFIGSIITLVLLNFFLSKTDPDRYSGGRISYGQIAFFGILTYLCITPIYIITGLAAYDNILIIFIIHAMTLAFGSSLILEVLWNYRYVLLGFYGSFIGLFFSSLIVLGLFSIIQAWHVKLLSMLIMLPLINASMVLFKELFIFLYYHYYKYTNQDGLGDIFYQIELEEKEALREEELKNNM